jgi:hypothetical protein
MKHEETIVNIPDYVIEKGVIEIPYEIIYDKNNPTSFTGSGMLGKRVGLISQGNSKEDLHKNMLDSFNSSISMYEQESNLLYKRAIWQSNYHKFGNGFSFWFRIIGLGMSITYSPDKTVLPRDKNNKPIKYLGINKAGGLVIGNVIMFFHNAWRVKSDETK